MAHARFERVGRRFGDVVALAGVDLSVEEGELLTVLGPSGCGKSTLLRCTAGLERLSEGEIHLAGRRIDALPPDARDVAMVFQSYALYPHMSVRQNIEFPLRMRRERAASRRARAEQAASLLEIDDLLERRPAALSGGQRQRVALARALVRRPALFLLDEPLSNLDTKLRTHVRRSLRELHRRLGITMLYVTHDQTEAMTLGDRIALLEGGRLRQLGTPQALWERPADTFVAGFLGSPAMNLIDAGCADGVLELGGQRFALPDAVRAGLGREPSRLLVGVRAEAFSAGPLPSGSALVVTLEPSACESLGSERLVRARLGEQHVFVRIFGAGDLPACVAAPADALHFFSAADGRRLGP